MLQNGPYVPFWGIFYLTRTCHYDTVLEVAPLCIACEDLKPDDELHWDGMCRACHAAAGPVKHIPRTMRRRALKGRFGLEYKDYSSMYAHQDGKCMICCKPLAKYKNKDGVETACVDHNHETGQIRGLLCRACNMGLGQFKDDPLLLDAAIEYLIENDQ